MASSRSGRKTGFRRARWMIFVALLMAWWMGGGALAQEGPQIIGAGAIQELLGAELDDWLATVDARWQRAGANRALAEFCAGEAQALLRLTPLSAAERADCPVEALELLLGHRLYGLISATDAPRQCLDEAAIDLLFAPSASGHSRDWQELDETLEAPQPITVWLPPADSVAYALLDRVAAGIGLREDARIYRNEAELTAALAGDDGALALAEIRADGPPADAQTLSLQTAEFGGCQAADIVSVEADSYPLALSVHLYLDGARLGEADSPLRALAQAAVEGALGEALLMPGEAAIEQNRARLSQDSAVVTSSSDSFTIPAVLGGQLRIGGAGEAGLFLPGIVEALAIAHPSLSAVSDLRGSPAAETALCAREIDLAINSRPLSESALAACAEAGVEVITLPAGAFAVVLLSNAHNAKSRCLSVAQLAELWPWRDEPMESEWTLFAPDDGAMASDWLMSALSGAAAPIRRDIEVSADPLWRAAAVAVMPGGLSYFSWEEYQQVLAAEQADIQAVRIGEYCTQPAPAEILAGRYPLRQPIYLHLDADVLASVQLKSWLWFTFGGASQSILSEAGPGAAGCGGPARGIAGRLCRRRCPCCRQARTGG